MRSLFGGLGRGHLDAGLLSAFLDRQTTQNERTRIETHLQTCADCRAELESLRSTVALLHALPRVAVPRAFTLSEAQVGIRRPAATPGWYGGMLRGLGAVAALALVAFVAVSLIQEPSWTPGQTVARAPTLTQPALAPTTAAAPVAEAMKAAPASTEAPGAAAAPAPEVAQQLSPAPQPTAELNIAAAPAPSTAAESARSAADATATEPPLAAMAAKAPETPAADSAGVMGRGGGGGGPSAAPPAEALTPEPVPPVAPLSQALPQGVRMVYADLQGLYAVDRDGSARELVSGATINMPQLSPDQKWIVYRTFDNDVLQLWAIPWEGGDPRLLLSSESLPKEGLPEGRTQRYFSDSRWAPGGHTLAVTLTASAAPDVPDVPTVTELWHLDVESGELKFLANLAGAYRPYYARDGKLFATLQYGSETDPQGALTVYRVGDGKRAAEGRVALAFQSGPGKPLYDSQIVWARDNQLLVAIPDADPQFQNPVQLNGATLYRVTGSSDAKPIGRVDGFQVAWAPNGQQLVFARYTTDTMETVELYVADANGANAQLYATTSMGAFISWSPDSSSFLYNDNYQIYVGAAGRPPVRLANAVSMWDPRWIDARQILSLIDQGEQGWWLTLRTVDGGAASLLALPRAAMLDVVSANTR